MKARQALVEELRTSVLRGLGGVGISVLGAFQV